MSTPDARLTAALVGAPNATAPDVQLPSPEMLALPERAIQFGTGAFVRGFVDYFLDRANAEGRFNGRVVAVGSTGSGRDRAFEQQDGLFTLVARGTVRGEAHEELRVIASVSRALSAADDWSAVLACARNPQLSLIFSNTTEVGIARDEEDTAERMPPRSFPGKLTRFLYERARTFAFARSKGVVVVPCELIEDNGDVLQTLVLELGARWGYGASFATWVEAAVPFCNTLVDRIVPGAPRGSERDALTTHLGFEDELLTTAEPFRSFIIEGDPALRARLGFPGADPDIVVTPDVRPYRERKVRLLNGAHTIAVSVALLAGCETVHDAMVHPLVGAFIRRVLLDDIVPTVDVPEADSYARSVLDRFENPYIRHALADITLHGTTKLRVRIVPTLLRAVEHSGRVPDALTLGFAAHLVRLRAAGAASGSGAALPLDELGERVREEWRSVDLERPESLRTFLTAVCGDESLWGASLAALPGFVDGVTGYAQQLLTHGAERTLDALLTARVA